LADGGERFDQREPEFVAAGLALWQKRNGAIEELDRRQIVAASECSPARRAEAFCRARCQLARALIGRVELDAVAVRLLEVVAEDFLVLAHAAVELPLQ